MAKARTAYVCNECGAEFSKWQGQCTECNAWNSLSEIVLESAAAAKAPASRRAGWAGKIDPPKITALKDVEQTEHRRVSTGIGEFDRVLGGGLVEGAVVLVGGDPGIGKSTLLLQAVAKMAAELPVLYVTGEESLAQVAGRAHRLELPLDGVNALAETGVESILQHASRAGPRLIVADSVQTLWTESLTAAPGSVSQVRESAARLVRFAKETGTAVFLVGHVTKEGGIAGPRVLEHMVDAVLYFEGESGSRFRLLRAFKNRFGAVNELGVFAMGDKGLKEVSNPSAIFLSGGSTHQPGSCVMVTREGTRPLLVEVQALVDASPLSNPAVSQSAWSRTAWPCCWRSCIATAACWSVTRTCSSTWSEASACRRPPPTCRCCWQCCPRCRTVRWRRRPSPSAKSACPARSARCPMARTACARPPPTASSAPSCPRPTRPRVVR